MKKVIAINTSPRTTYNTATLVNKAAEGARSNGAEVEVIDLYRIQPFTGCISCFACKRESSYGVCACKDGLWEVLDKIRNADGLIIGSPNYLGDLTAGFRALYERLVFQSLTYNLENPCCNKRKIPVLLITTSNCDVDYYETVGYDKMLENYKKTLSDFVGETTILISGNTRQVKDYSIYNWTLFDAEAKQKSFEEQFPIDCEKAFEAGAKL